MPRRILASILGLALVTVGVTARRLVPSRAAAPAGLSQTGQDSSR
jgi:hypothetical protein